MKIVTRIKIVRQLRWYETSEDRRLQTRTTTDEINNANRAVETLARVVLLLVSRILLNEVIEMSLLILPVSATLITPGGANVSFAAPEGASSSFVAPWGASSPLCYSKVHQVLV